MLSSNVDSILRTVAHRACGKQRRHRATSVPVTMFARSSHAASATTSTNRVDTRRRTHASRVSKKDRRTGLVAIRTRSKSSAHKRMGEEEVEVEVEEEEEDVVNFAHISYQRTLSVHS